VIWFPQPLKGFTLIELVIVVVILAILAVLVIPKYIDLSQSARISAVQGLAATVSADANNASLQCVLTSNCFGNNVTWLLTVAGRNYQIWNGYPDAGDNIGTNEIDVLVNASSQFTVSIVPPQITLWKFSSAPDPNNCAVQYQEALSTKIPPVVTTLTSGC
jgi:MSHA pilin protein MshA